MGGNMERLNIYVQILHVFLTTKPGYTARLVLLREEYFPPKGEKTPPNVTLSMEGNPFDVSTHRIRWMAQEEHAETEDKALEIVLSSLQRKCPQRGPFLAVAGLVENEEERP